VDGAGGGEVGELLDGEVEEVGEELGS